VPRSIKNVLQLLGFTEKHQERSVALGPCELLSSAKMQSIEEWDLPRSVENVLQSLSFTSPIVSKYAVDRGVYCAEKTSRTLRSSWASPRSEKRRERSAVLELCEPLPRGCRCRFGQSRIGLSREASRTFSSSRDLRTSTARLPVQLLSIKDWAASGSVKNIPQFLGFANLFANLYRHFIEGFSKWQGR
jgi:hypothetical protein